MTNHPYDTPNKPTRSKEMEEKMQRFTDAGKYAQDQFIDFEPERHIYYYTGLPAGKIFLKCFEATENIPLSEDRIPERSAVSVGSTEGFPFHQMVDHQCFTIYEGDYEDYYAARMEVWFRDSLSGAERKLTEKVYRVEGWMR